MKRKLALLTVFTIAFIGVLIASLNLRFQRVEAGGTIYIRADGSIDPATAPIERDGDVYTLTGYIYEPIVVERDNIVVDGAGYVVQGGGGGRGIDLSDRTNVTVKNMEIKTFNTGIFLSSSINNTVVRNNITNNGDYGIRLDSCSGNSIYGNNIKENSLAVYFHSSEDNIVSENNIADNSYGIYLYQSSSNTFSLNNIDGNTYGILLSYCSHNTMAGNNLKDNAKGIQLTHSSNNKFYHNNFLNNTEQVDSQVSGYANFWDKSYPYGGNYWSDYAGVDSDHDGIGDALYTIDGDNVDNYPLMGMFRSFNTSLGCLVNVVSNSTINSFHYFESNTTIKMYVSNSSVTQNYGFCRVCIPHLLMNVSNISVIIDEGEINPSHFNNMTYDNGTHRWIYFAYPHSTHEINIIPELPSFLIAPLLATTTLLVAIAYRKRRENKK